MSIIRFKTRMGAMHVHRHCDQFNRILNYYYYVRRFILLSRLQWIGAR